MKVRSTFLIILYQTIAVASASAQVEYKYREIGANIAFGITVPSDEWREIMNSGVGFDVHVGIALSRRFDAGLFFSYEIFEPKDLYVTDSAARIGDNNFTRYAGGIFGEYNLTDSRLAPFIAGYIGAQGIHIYWAETMDGHTGEGDYGFGYGFSSGLKYRLGNRFGATFRIQAENSPSMDSGWFINARLGMTVFL